MGLPLACPVWPIRPEAVSSAMLLLEINFLLDKDGIEAMILEV